MLKPVQITTPKGSLTNARTVEIFGRELFFSYSTLVGVRDSQGNFFYQRDGKASSQTTGRHINLWLGAWSKSMKSAGVKSVSESELEALANTAEV